MRKITVAFIMFFSMAWVTSSCRSSEITTIPTVTPTSYETATPTQFFDDLTPVITPTLNTVSVKEGGIIVTLGEIVGRQGFWPAIPAFSPDGKMLALVGENVTLWDVETHKRIYELSKPYSSCYTENVIFSSDGKLLAASIDCYQNPTGYVLIWNTESGGLLDSWEQAFSKDTTESDELFNRRPATGIAFLPDSSRLAFANGNTIEIRDVQEDSQPIIFDLGDEMFASDIAISEDGKRLFAFMDFSYTKTANEVGQKYALQTWDLQSEKIVEQINFPEPANMGLFYGHFDVEMKLLDSNLISIDYINEAFTVTNLETGGIRNLHYFGDVETFVSPNSNYVAYVPEARDKIVLWNTHLNQSASVVITSNKDFGSNWSFGPHTMAFSPDSTILAIAHEERVSLWDITGVP